MPEEPDHARAPVTRAPVTQTPLHEALAPGTPAPGASVTETPGNAGTASTAPPTWATAKEALGVCLHRPNRRRIAAIAAVVGTLLIAINEGGALAAGQLGWALWVRAALDYVIPTCVSTMGVLAGSRRTAARGASRPHGSS